MNILKPDTPAEWKALLDRESIVQADREIALTRACEQYCCTRAGQNRHQRPHWKLNQDGSIDLGDFPQELAGYVREFDEFVPGYRFESTAEEDPPKQVRISCRIVERPLLCGAIRVGWPKVESEEA